MKSNRLILWVCLAWLAVAGIYGAIMLSPYLKERQSQHLRGTSFATRSSRLTRANEIMLRQIGEQDRIIEAKPISHAEKMRLKRDLMNAAFEEFRRVDGTDFQVTYNLKYP